MITEVELVGGSRRVERPILMALGPEVRNRMSMGTIFFGTMEGREGRAITVLNPVRSL